MKKQISFLTLLVSVILCGCNHSTQPFIFNKVKNLMQSNPDSAYSLLATINTDRHTECRKLCALVYAES